VKLINIDAEGQMPELPPRTGGELWALVRFHGQPLGILELDATRPCTPDDLRRVIASRFSGSILQHLVADGLATNTFASLQNSLRSLPRDCPQINRTIECPILTVAVCTRDRAAHLVDCLDAVQSLDYPPDRLDILVVDNAPSDDATQKLLANRSRRVRYVREDRPGLNWARNRAVHEARGELLAFVDDDVIVDAAWARAMTSAFDEEPDAMCVTGLVVAHELDVPAQRLFEQYGGFSRGFRRIYGCIDAAAGERAASAHGGTGKFGTGGNMAYRRRLFDQIGLFDPALDVGTVTNGGGDLEMFFRLIKAGHLLVYEPCAVVRHRHRRTYEQLRTQLANNGIGFYSYLVRAALNYPDERLAIARLGLWWFWHWNIRRLLVSFVRPRRFPRDLILAELRGSFIGLWRYPAARRRAAHILAAHQPQQPSATGARS
jgi:GT2 family glycosyltransferase